MEKLNPRFHACKAPYQQRRGLEPIRNAACRHSSLSTHPPHLIMKSGWKGSHPLHSTLLSKPASKEKRSTIWIRVWAGLSQKRATHPPLYIIIESTSCTKEPAAATTARPQRDECREVMAAFWPHALVLLHQPDPWFMSGPWAQLQTSWHHHFILKRLSHGSVRPQSSICSCCLNYFLSLFKSFSKLTLSVPIGAGALKWEMDAEVWDSEQDQIWNPRNITQQDMLDTASLLASSMRNGTSGVLPNRRDNRAVRHLYPIA